MKVVILAAGNSSRLIDLTRESPKCLLPLNHTTILGKQLDNLHQVGLDEVIISAGYKIEKIEEYFEGHSWDLTIHIEYNPFYDISNNIMSLWNVRHLIRDHSAMIINGDNVFDYQILETLLQCPHENVLMVQVKEEYDGDDMKVRTDGERLLAVNKSMMSSEASAESIGIMKFSASGINHLMDKLVSMVTIKENHQVWYLRAIQEVIDDGLPVCICSIGDSIWEEVDFQIDYKRVRNMKWD
ncbi:MAG: phosphocholine cytidylyltransferase family protein [Candidatus Marinimicrobia bacterium]|nr:phosphocholine cytidylyltransferase family protein [Candidatus Neomarinimicrobiota bacterium]